MKKITMLALAMGAIMSTQVMAADNRINVSGSYCGAYAGVEAGKVDRTYSGITNTSAATVTVMCPVIADEVNNVTGTNQILVNTSAAGTTCWFFSVNADGSARQWVLNSGGPGWVTIPNVTSDDISGSYTLGCNLPAGATLRTITVSEKP